ncbi:hypothetical protein, partial [Arcicella aurantiaca]|uniref:hypothetical protein n=1 Tax=Arcicella aurantiaca TaxID=591202 RepID=UPI001B86613E
SFGECCLPLLIFFIWRMPFVTTDSLSFGECYSPLLILFIWRMLFATTDFLHLANAIRHYKLLLHTIQFTVKSVFIFQ